MNEYRIGIYHTAKGGDNTVYMCSTTSPITAPINSLTRSVTQTSSAYRYRNWWKMSGLK